MAKVIPMKHNHSIFLQDYNLENNPETSLFHIIPVPYEKTVSYGHGAANGPEAILKASSKLELYDCFSSPYEHGIFTQPPVDCDKDELICLEEINNRVKSVLDKNKIPVILGGEHTVSVGAFKAFKQKFNDIGVVQFDAHTDLRDSYFGGNLSHACVMRRAFEMNIRIFQIGIRSLSLEEEIFRKENNIPSLDAWNIAKNGIPSKILPDDFPENIYITFDVDGLDPSIIPATGTPEPGGLDWYQSLDMIEKIACERSVKGLDFVELAPIAGMHAPDYAVARLIYNIFGILSRN